MASSSPPPKKQRTDESKIYTLLYHAGIPGRGELIRLVFEATGTAYIDTAKTDQAGSVYSLIGDKADLKALDGNTPLFAPPILKVSGAGKNGNDLYINQTGNILSYLGEQLGLAGSDEADKYHVQQLALTALDLLVEAHDTHHPVAVMDYYEDQKDEALKKSASFRKTRIPKYLGYFDRVLKANAEGKGKYLVGSSLTYADLVIWQILDGLKFAFPKEMTAREGEKEFPDLCGTFYPNIKEKSGIKEYLASDRRAPYSQGIFRHYPELDRE